MQDFSTASVASDLSQITYVESLPTAVTLPVNLVTPFAEQMSVWLNIFSSSDEKSIFDFNSIERAKLAQQFNCFMESLLRQAERLKQYAEDSYLTASQGCTTRPYSESHFLRRLVTLSTDLTPYSPSHNEERKPYKQTYWQVTESVLETSFNAIVTIRVLQNTQTSTEEGKSSAIHFLFDALKEYLQAFSDIYQVFLKELEEALSLMSGTQLARICLNEMEFMNSSVLIGMVLKSPVLWTRMNKAFEEEEIMYSGDATTLVTLRQFHEDFNLFLILVRELPLITQFDTKGVLVKEISRIFENLPAFLQIELAPALNNVQGEFREWHCRHSIDLEEQKQGGEESNLSPKNDCTIKSTIDDREQTKLPSQQKVSTERGNEVDAERHANRLFFFGLSEFSKLSSSTDELLVKKEILPFGY